MDSSVLAFGFVCSCGRSITASVICQSTCTDEKGAVRTIHYSYLLCVKAKILSCECASRFVHFAKVHAVGVDRKLKSDERMSESVAGPFGDRSTAAKLCG